MSNLTSDSPVAIPQHRDLAKLAGGNLAVTLMIDEDGARMQVWDLGYHGTQEEPLLLTEQGWQPCAENPDMVSVGIRKAALYGRELTQLDDEDEIDDDELHEACDRLLSGANEVMRALRTR